MTNGEMIQKIFNCEVCEPIMEEDIIHVIFPDKNDSAIGFDWSWWNMEYKEPTTKNNLGVDCIDRAELLEAMDTWDKFGYTETGCFVREPKGDYVPYVHYEDMVNCVKGMPSVTPIRPKGHWIDKQHLFDSCSAECSSCHKRSDGYIHDNGFSLECKYYDFCPECGAKMVEPQESEAEDGNDD